MMSPTEFNKRLMLAAVVLLGSLSASPLLAESSFIHLGTGGVTGVYYPTGGAICRLVNKGRKEHGIRCSVESTDGSVYNINSLRTGDLDMAVVQSDWQFHAYNGSSKFREQGDFKELRSLFSVHSEPFTVIARADSGISDIQDLKGKRVNIGNPGSGQRGTMEVVMAALGWTPSIFSNATELTSSEQAIALCENKIDAMVNTLGHPSGSIKQVTTICDSVLVNVSDPAIDRMVRSNIYYRQARIPGGMYRGSPKDTQTFGVGATFVSSTKASSDTVYQVVKAVFENLDELRKMHPAFAHLKKSEMVKDGLSAPLHDGAKRYYQEAGLM